MELKLLPSLMLIRCGGVKGRNAKEKYRQWINKNLYINFVKVEIVSIYQFNLGLWDIFREIKAHLADTRRSG